MENAISDLTPEDRALLDFARDGHEPTDRDRGRVRLALQMQLGVGTGLAVTTAATSKAAAALVVTKVIATLAVAGVIGGAGVVTYRMTHPARTHVVATTLASARTALHTPEGGEALGLRRADLPDPAIQPQSAKDAIPSANAVRAKRNVEPIANRPAAPASLRAAWPEDPKAVLQEPPIAPPDVPTTTAPPLSPLPPTTLEAETRLVRGGVAALHSGDAARALVLFDEHARTFPNGALAEERAAERVVALGDLHRNADARAAAAAFLRDHPHSPLSARVRESCACAPNP